MVRTPNSPTFDRIQRDRGRLIQHARDIETLTVFEWSEDGVQQNAFGDEVGVVIPADAAKIELQLYNFPTCQLRKIYFPPRTRTPWHANHDDVILYSIDAHQVEFVGTQSFYARPGDATLHPVGVEHHSETLVPGWRLEFAFDAQPGLCGRDLIALPGQGLRWHDMAEWVTGDSRQEIFVGDTAVPANAQRFSARLYHFPVYSLRECRWPSGSTLPTHVSDSETLIYVLSGRLQLTVDALSEEMLPGSMARIPAGARTARIALQDCLALELPGFRTPRPYPR
jgi:quercetin dioxygenase-like cupin family protein